MKKLFVLMLILINVEIIFSQNEFQKFINHVNSLSDPASKVAAVDSFMVYARSQGIPFITGDSANFIYLGTASSIAVAGDFTFWNTNVFMTKLNQTNFWYYSRAFEMDARLDYKFVLNGSNWILDPENPKTISGGFGPNSELSMPAYIQPWEINYHPSIPHGIVLNKTIFSNNVGTNYQLQIYLPPGYDSLSAETYPTVYFQDGFEYISLASAVNVLDNLLDSNKIQKIIAVFVQPNNRNVEYAGNLRLQYTNFFVNELVPYIDGNFKTKQNPSQRLVLGDSYGGNISALISYNHPDVFGNCGLHSGAFQPNNYEIYAQVMTDLANGIVKDIKWSSIWGTYEESLTGTMRSFKDSLIAHNYAIDWEERHEGHSWGQWRATIDNMLVYFFPYNLMDIKSEEIFAVRGFKLLQNFPNPFNPTTKIIWQSSIGCWQSIKIYDILGNEILRMIDEYKPAGTYEIDFRASDIPSGVYFYQLKAGEYVEAKKMILLK
ncbi:MAG TPA: hypothetical protein DHV28_07965 [Ignavibacteriales bacterium]|nr:hypothetical protein [Ignavibacteriales bacterium]